MLLDRSIRYPWEYCCDYTLWHQKLRHGEKNAKMARYAWNRLPVSRLSGRWVGPGMRLAAWIEELGWQNLVNRRSTSWKALDEQARMTMDEVHAHSAILSHPTLIKRPLLDIGQQRFVGFSAATLRQNIQSTHPLNGCLIYGGTRMTNGAFALGLGVGTHNSHREWLEIFFAATDLASHAATERLPLGKLR